MLPTNTNVPVSHHHGGLDHWLVAPIALPLVLRPRREGTPRSSHCEGLLFDVSFVFDLGSAGHLLGGASGAMMFTKMLWMELASILDT